MKEKFEDWQRERFMRERATPTEHWIWTNKRIKELPKKCRDMLVEWAKEDVRLCIENNGADDAICQSMAEDVINMEVYFNE